GRGLVEGEPGDLQLAQAVAEAAAAVGLLDTAGERALAPDARPVGVGEARAGEGAGREEERVARGQGVDGGRAQVEQRLGDQETAGLDDRLALELPLGDRAVMQVDVVVRAHRWLLAFLPVIGARVMCSREPRPAPSASQRPWGRSTPARTRSGRSLHLLMPALAGGR